MRGLLLLCLLLGIPAAPQAAPRVVEASIASSGMVLLSLDARLGPDGRLAFDTPAAHLDDWLKSVRLPEGWTLLLAPDPERPVLPRAGGPDALIAALAGQEVRHVRQDRVLHAGRIVGLRPPAAHDGSDPHPLLALQGPQGLTVDPWRPGDRVEPADPRLAAALEAALQGQAAEMLPPRRTLVLQGPPDAAGRIDVLLGGPAWSASHRARVAEDGTVRLETWAHVRNGTGLPWENVRLVLVSGQARAIAVPLSIPRFPPRTPPEPARADAGPGPARAPMAAPLAGGQARARQSLADSATAETAPAPPPADMLQGQPAGAVFRLATPLTLPDGALATLALAAETPEGGVVRSIRPSGAPVEVGLRLRHGTGPDLPPGVLTATQGGGHLGDALLPPWPGGETRRVALGTDPAITTTDRRETRLRGQAAWAAAGVLHLLSAEETRLRAEMRNTRADPVTIDFWSDLPPEATVLSGHADGPGRAAATETLPPQARGSVEIAWRTSQRWSTPALDADPGEIRRRLANAPANAPGIADAMAWASRLEARMNLAARLADADRRIQRLAQGISPERERTARLLAGAEQTEALAALAQAARAHAQAVAQRDRLGTEIEALDAALRRDGARLSFGTPP